MNRLLKAAVGIVVAASLAACAAERHEPREVRSDMTWLEMQGARTIAVVTVEKERGVSVQRGTMENKTALGGENRWEVTVLPMPIGSSIFGVTDQTLAYFNEVRNSKEDVMVLAEKEFRGMRTRIDETPRSNAIGEYMFLTAEGNGVTCIYAWQTVIASRAKPLGSVGGLGIRFRDCEAGASAETILSRFDTARLSLASSKGLF